MNKRPSYRCTACGQMMRLTKKRGGFEVHLTDKHNQGSPRCPGSGQRPLGPSAEDVVREAFVLAFFEHFALGSQEWGPDRDNESAADAALAALRTIDLLVVGGAVYLVADHDETYEAVGERRWTITTRSEGEPYIDGVMD